MEREVNEAEKLGQRGDFVCAHCRHMFSQERGALEAVCAPCGVSVHLMCIRGHLDRCDACQRENSETGDVLGEHSFNKATAPVPYPACCHCGRPCGKGPETETTKCGKPAHHGACILSHFETCKECRLDSWPENGFDFGIPRDGADGVGDDLEADFLVFGAAVEYVFCLVVFLVYVVLGTALAGLAAETINILQCRLEAALSALSGAWWNRRGSPDMASKLRSSVEAAQCDHMPICLRTFICLPSLIGQAGQTAWRAWPPTSLQR